MSFTPLILKGNLKIGVDSGTAVDVSDQVTGITIKAEVDIVEIPGTLSTSKQNRAGATSYAIDLAYLSDDSASTLFQALWLAATNEDGTKTLYFEGSMKQAAVSASNPKWSGTFIVAAAQVGGTADALSEASGTYPLTGAPTQVTS